MTVTTPLLSLLCSGSCSIQLHLHQFIVVERVLVGLIWLIIPFCFFSLQRGLLYRTCIRILRNHFQKRKFLVFFFSLTVYWFPRWEKCHLIGGWRIKEMYNHFNERSGQKAPLIADDVYEIIMKVIILIMVFYSVWTLKWCVQICTSLSNNFGHNLTVQEILRFFRLR